MRSQVVTPGRRVVLALEPGDEVLTSIAAACRAHEIAQAVIVTFCGAFRTADLIAGDHAPDDPELPSPEVTRVRYTEGVGSGTVTREGAEHTVHVHVALGSKDSSGAAVAGHLLHAQTHYVTEIVLDEVLDPPLARVPHPEASGVRILGFADDAEGRPA